MIYIDSGRLRDEGQNVIKNVNDFYSRINEVFNNIDDIGKTGGSWSGTSAKNFIFNANIDKIQYLNFGATLKTYGESMVASADKVDQLCREIRYRG